MLRHLLEEPRVLNCAGLPAERSHILRPIADFCAILVTAAICSDGLVIMEKLHVVKENLGLYQLPDSCGDNPYLFVSTVTNPVLLTVSVSYKRRSARKIESPYNQQNVGIQCTSVFLR